MKSIKCKEWKKETLLGLFYTWILRIHAGDSESLLARRGDYGIARKLQQYPEACEQYPRI